MDPFGIVLAYIVVALVFNSFYRRTATDYVFWSNPIARAQMALLSASPVVPVLVAMSSTP